MYLIIDVRVNSQREEVREPAYVSNTIITQLQKALFILNLYCVLKGGWHVNMIFHIKVKLSKVKGVYAHQISLTYIMTLQCTFMMMGGDLV